MKEKTYNTLACVLGCIVIALVVAVVILMSVRPTEAEHLEYTIDENETGIENSADYGMRQAPDDLYGTELEETSTTFYGPQ